MNHTSRPLVRGKLVFERVVPLDGPITDGPLIRVGYPLQRGTLRFDPIAPAATVNLRLPLAAEGSRMVETLHALVAKVNETEAIFGRTGVWVDSERSGVRGGELTLVLAPNDPTDAIDTCKRVADYLFAAIRKTAKATVKVFAADQPDTPVYELAV